MIDRFLARMGQVAWGYRTFSDVKSRTGFPSGESEPRCRPATSYSSSSTRSTPPRVDMSRRYASRPRRPISSRADVGMVAASQNRSARVAQSSGGQDSPARARSTISTVSPPAEATTGEAELNAAWSLPGTLPRSSGRSRSITSW